METLTRSMKNQVEWRERFRKEFANTKPDQLIEMLITSLEISYDRVEIIKEAYSVMTLSQAECEAQEIDRVEVVKRMENELEGFMVDKPY